MKKILIFSGSNSSRSINFKLLIYVSEFINDYDVEVIKLTDYDIPMFSEDIERDTGYSKGLKILHSKIRRADGLIISVPEHNGNLPAFFKNILDWLSRLERSFLEKKKIFLLGTSPGRGGASSSMEQAKKIIPAFKGDIVASFNLPSFTRNFSDKIEDTDLNTELKTQLKTFLSSF